MITKRTDELKPGDRVHTPYGLRTVKMVQPTNLTTDFGTHCVTWEKVWYPSPNADWIEEDHKWEVEAPSPLDLAVQRAQELADEYHYQNVFTEAAAQNFARLLDLFRAAR